ncbi:MAG: hypothetical protein M3480_04710 [Verrucomicrobiota bacterium]|nr:hypothetical protein [Chthoniobacterales bacterium]MDQ3414264.1 hypothetical protein [Verrucomicrobiota bacterium]
MASRRVPRHTSRRRPVRGGVRVPPYIVPTRRGTPPSGLLMVPTKWVKFIVALFLLPICALLSQTLFTSFARATVAERLWAGEEFWFFSLGAILWLIAFFGLPRPLLIYVFGHELTHALWVWMMGGRVSRFKVGREGGHILTDKNNFLIALAPYFFPLYSILVLALYGALSLFLNLQPYGRFLYALLGITWAFHFTFTCWMIPKNQTDLNDNGTIFSLVVIYLINLILLSVLLVIASPGITFEGFGADIVRNLANFSHMIVTLCERFSRGA